MNAEQITEAAKQNPLVGYAVLAGTFAFMIWSNRAFFAKHAARLWSLVPNLPAIATTPVKPKRLDALAHLDAAFNYFEAIGCKEGMDAIQLAGRHAFEHREAA